MAIHFSSVTYLYNEDGEATSLDRVDDPIVPGANPQQFHLAAKVLNPCRPGVLSQAVNPTLDPFLVGFGNRFKLS